MGCNQTRCEARQREKTWRSDCKHRYYCILFMFKQYWVMLVSLEAQNSFLYLWDNKIVSKVHKDASLSLTINNALSQQVLLSRNKVLLVGLKFLHLHWERL